MMSNSNLVSYSKISPNKTSPRNKKIDTITIHHMAGNLSIERCGQLFADPNRDGSSNYGVGTDGRIAMYVEEKDRAWTSSSGANDHRAITIEVANDGGSPDWHVSDKALNATINLVVDICKRNGISKLVWSNNKSDRINHKNGCNMTVHQDFAATTCPGLIKVFSVLTCSLCFPNIQKLKAYSYYISLLRFTIYLSSRTPILVLVLKE